ncbi:glycosyltransferase family 4 protein [Flavobacterium microcysteis]|uniref:Glycosyltransferase family 4 protein n=1 Tax=Flavobacterium microcysteis TaxID=2596891 RepID=A0A501QA52_9FLAO|nr:glycosyltransferase family 4 protein [Flavobacterium microcysteis]TPD69780.1 glycosyltransferase family 4 protein [Flavobacterium microcysteis]
MKNLLYIGNKLSQHGFSVTSIETLGPLLEGEGYTLFYASSKKNKAVRLFDMLWTTIQLRNKVDYILIDTYSTSNFWYAFFVSQLARLLKIKYIPMLRGGDLPQRIAKNPGLCNMVFNHAYKNSAPSGYLFEYFQKQGIQNMVYIPNTLDIQNYTFKEREIEQPKLLWVRAFAAIYNPFMAIEVFRHIKKEFPEASLCMVGPEKDGMLEKTKELVLKYQLDVKFTGKLAKADWIQLSQNYNIFINTTHFDNMPVSVMEAMALGLPVVSTNVGGIPFLLEDEKTALLVEDGNTESMIDAVKKIVENKNLALDLAQNARKKAESFDWQQVKLLWNKILC